MVCWDLRNGLRASSFLFVLDSRIADSRHDTGCHSRIEAPRAYVSRLRQASETDIEVFERFSCTFFALPESHSF